ncbi:hypothetical protein [Pseudochryseolinea flava]|nr:hypothetical protein [Pseudochryseolinea flava]
MAEITIADIPFKVLLSCFGTEKVEIMELGDTGYGREGFVDESWFKRYKTTDELCQQPYDFGGLVIFDGQIGRYTITYVDGYYQVSSSQKDIEKIQHELRSRGITWQERRR